MKKLYLILASIFIAVALSGCIPDAQVASSNISTASDQFEVMRRIVFYNGITDKYILSVEGRCSINFHSLKFIVICKTGPRDYKKHYLGRADNVFPFVEQLDSVKASVYHYRVIFKPSVIIPNIELK